jgi:hypothetical protein
MFYTFKNFVAGARSEEALIYAVFWGRWRRMVLVRTVDSHKNYATPSIPEDSILHCYLRESTRSYIVEVVFV